MIYQLIFEATLFLLYYYYSLLLQFIRERIRIIFRLRTSLHIRLAAHIKPQGERRGLFQELSDAWRFAEWRYLEV